MTGQWDTRRSPTSPFLCKDIMPLGRRIKHIFHHTIHLNISFPKKAHFRLCFCIFVMKTDKCMYGKLILFAFYQPTEIITCNNHSNSFVFSGQPYTCAQRCALLHRIQAHPPVSSPLITLLSRYGKLVLLLHRNLFTDVNICVWLGLLCMHNFANRITCNAVFHISVLVAQINFKAILDTLLRKVYAIFLITPLWSICSQKLNFLNKGLKYGLICQQSIFLQLHNDEFCWYTIQS